MGLFSKEHVGTLKWEEIKMKAHQEIRIEQKYQVGGYLSFGGVLPMMVVALRSYLTQSTNGTVILYSESQ